MRIMHTLQAYQKYGRNPGGKTPEDIGI